MEIDISRRIYMRAYFDALNNEKPKIRCHKSPEDVFNRLINDTNKRTERDVKIQTFRENSLSESVKKSFKLTNVFERLKNDTGIRTAREHLKEKYISNIEDEKISKPSSLKLLTKDKAEELVQRLSSIFINRF